MLPATLSDFIVFLGTPAFIGFLTAHVLIHLAIYMDLTPLGKQIVTLVLSAIFGVLSLLLIQLVSPATLNQLQPIYAIIAAIISTWFGNQVTMNGLLLEKLLQKDK